MKLLNIFFLALVISTICHAGKRNDPGFVLQNTIRLGGFINGLIGSKANSDIAIERLNIALSKLPADHALSTQMAIWELYDSGYFSEYEVAKDSLEFFMKQAPVRKIHYDVRKTKLGTYQSRAFLVEFYNGMKAVFKPGKDGIFNYKHEVAAYEIDRLAKFNMVPVTVIRSFAGIRGSLQLFFPGVPGYHPNRQKTPDERAHKDFKKKQVFDFIINYQDRLSNYNSRDCKNLMVADCGRLALIDNGWSFDEDVFNASLTETTLFKKFILNGENNPDYTYYPGPFLINRLRQVSKKDLEFLYEFEVEPHEVYNRIQDILNWFESAGMEKYFCGRLFLGRAKNKSLEERAQ